MKVCIIGCGQVAEYHASTWKTLPFREIHFVDKKIELAQSFVKRSKVPAKSFIEIPNEQYDLGIILTPSGTHREIAEIFLKRDIPIFVEKPLALKWADLLWFEEQERARKWITAGFQCRYLDSVNTIKNTIKDDLIIFIDCWKYRCRQLDYYDDWHGTWKWDGGVITQQGIHCVDLVCMLTDEEPQSVYMVGKNIKHKIECEDTAALMINYAGFSAQVRCSTALNIDGQGGIFVTTDSGTVGVEGFAFSSITKWDSTHYKPRKDLLWQGEGRENMWNEIVKNLNKNSLLPPSEANKCMKIVHTGYKSMESGVSESYPQKFEKLGC